MAPRLVIQITALRIWWGLLQSKRCKPGVSRALGLPVCERWAVYVEILAEIMFNMCLFDGDILCAIINSMQKLKSFVDRKWQNLRWELNFVATFWKFSSLVSHIQVTGWKWSWFSSLRVDSVFCSLYLVQIFCILESIISSAVHPKFGILNYTFNCLMLLACIIFCFMAY